MKNESKSVLRTWRINIERLVYRVRRRLEKRRDERILARDPAAQLKAIEKAEILSKRRKCRLWVIRVEPGRYRIYTKGDVKAVLRALGLKGRIDLFSINGTVVHITK